MIRKGGSRSRPVGGKLKLFAAYEIEPGRSYHFPSSDICRDREGNMKTRAQCHGECMKNHVYEASADQIMRGPWPMSRFLGKKGQKEYEDALFTHLEGASSSSSSSSSATSELNLDAHTLQLINQQYARDNMAYDNMFSGQRGREGVWETGGISIVRSRSPG